MNDLNLNWHASIIEAKEQESPWANEHGTLVISGELVNGDICANNFALEPDELEKLAKQVEGARLMLDHSKSARDVIGGFRKGVYDKEKNRVLFEAEVDDPAIQRSIMKGRLKYVSIGGSADVFCSVCNKSTKPIRACKCKGSHDVVRNSKFKEGSIITEPAYSTSKFEPVSFIASITSALAENQVMPISSEEDKARPYVLNKNIGEKEKMSEDVKATTLKPAGADAVVLLGEKFEALMATVTRMEEKSKKEDEAKKKAIEDEFKKKDEDEAKKKQEAYSKLEALVTKCEEMLKPKKEEGGIPKDVPKFEKKPFPPEEEEEPEEKPCKKEMKGAKIEAPSETKVEITADAVPSWFKEIKAYAEKHLMD